MHQCNRKLERVRSYALCFALDRSKMLPNVLLPVVFVEWATRYAGQFDRVAHPVLLRRGAF